MMEEVEMSLDDFDSSDYDQIDLPHAADCAEKKRLFKGASIELGTFKENNE